MSKTRKRYRPIRIIIADAQPIVRLGFRALIADTPDVQVIGEAADGHEAIRKCRQLQPDLLVLDMAMPDRGGVEIIRMLHQEHQNIAILAMSNAAKDEQILPAIRAGAHGYLLKDSALHQLLQAIYDVDAGKPALDSIATLKMIQSLKPLFSQNSPGNSLSTREVEVLKLVAQGLTNQDIANQLFIEDRTVGNHISNILGKLQLANRTQAALYALREGLVTLERTGI